MSDGHGLELLNGQVHGEGREAGEQEPRSLFGPLLYFIYILINIYIYYIYIYFFISIASRCFLKLSLNLFGAAAVLIHVKDRVQGHGVQHELRDRRGAREPSDPGVEQHSRDEEASHTVGRQDLEAPRRKSSDSFKPR